MILLLTFLQAFVAIPSAWAFGGSMGNGGQSIVCGHDRFANPEAYDLFEGHSLFGYQYLPKTGEIGKSGLEQALAFAARLDALPHSLDAAYFTKRVKYVAEQVEIVANQQDLALTSDINETILPPDCRLVQVIVFYDNFTIQANRTALNQLSEESKAALYLHEAIYWYLRDAAKDTNSRRTRRIVSYLLNGGDLADAPLAFGSYDPTPAFCDGFDLLASGFYLLLDPAGKLSSLTPTGDSSHANFFRGNFSGQIAGGSLEELGIFSPSSTADFQGLLPLGAFHWPQPIKLHLDRQGALLESLRLYGSQEQDFPLSCKMVSGPLGEN